ncbi:hypothetical protein NEFER03_0787 [Nematocida sp. LUAm3]|nr:hypothetical protein NEFER03_0787 [Nematocida sp. LUAm3]KAI5175246.1 hypothetical protein NEFER02_1207 [Nematocida sp. LUAm2]KAI5178082.1 hypothetical protein NEFER01_1260 [Nematocida sp. LUAm1]
MEIFLKREKRRTYIIAYAWKILVALIMLLSTMYGIEDFLEESANIEEEKNKIIDVLMSNFNIFITSANHDYYLDVHYLYLRIKHIDMDINSAGKYYIDLEGYDITRNGHRPKRFDYNSVQNILKTIGAIRCRRLYIGQDIPLKVTKMLIERTAIEKNIEIYGNFKENIDFGASFLNCTTCHLRKKILGQLNWNITNPISISIGWCPWEFIEDFLEKWIGVREIKQIYVYHSNIDKIDFQKLKMAEGCSIGLEDFPHTKKIVLPKEAMIMYKYIRLLSLPNLEKISNIRNIYYGRTIDNLSLDKSSFKALIKAYRECISLENFLLVKALHLFCMSRTFQEVWGKSFPWIIAEKIIIYIEYCKFCGISKEEDMVYYSPEAIKTMDIRYLEGPVYKNIANDIAKFLDKRMQSRIFLKRIEGMSVQISTRFFKCQNYITSENNYARLPQLKIYLKNSKSIQEAIEEFQKSYNTLCVHAHYSMLDIDGFEAIKEDTKVLRKMFTCMGARIKVDMLRFHNVKGSIDEEVSEEKLIFVDPPKIMFAVQSVEFYNSKVSFIRSMFTKYIYPPGVTVVIDCMGIKKEEDLWGLFPRMIRKELFEVKLMNTEKIMEDLHKNGCSIDKKLLDSENNPVLPIGNLKWAKKTPYIINSIFSKKNTISSAHLSKLARESLKESKKTKNRKELFHFLVSNSVEEAYRELKRCMKTVYHVVWVGIYIYDLDTNNASIDSGLLSWVGMLKEVFVDLEVLCILNLMIQEHEVKCWNISHVVDPLKNMCRLQDVVLKHYTLIDEQGKDITTQLDYKERIVKCYSGEEILDKLANTNIAINLRVLWYMLQSIVTEDEILSNWIKSILDDEECIICGESISKIAEAYIMWHCGHWQCMKCAIKCAKGYLEADSDKDRNTCHMCRAPAEFDKEFYLLNLKDPEREEQIKAKVEREREERKAAPNPPSLEQSNEKPKDVAETDQVPSEDLKETIIEEFEEFKMYLLMVFNPKTSIPISNG